MSNKRATKNRKRLKKKEARKASDDRRQSRLTTVVDQHPAATQAVDKFILNFRHEKQFDLVMGGLLAPVEMLGLMKIKTHKDPVAAAIATIFRMATPDHQAKWRSNHQATISAALHLFPEPEENELFDVCEYKHVHQCMVAWMVSGDMQWPEAVYLGAVSDAVPKSVWQTAQAALNHYANRHKVIQEWLQDKLEAEQRKNDAPAPEYQAAVDELTEKLAKSPEWQKVAFVAYESETLVIGTFDGQSIKNMPSVVGDYPILTRQALPAEIKEYERWRSDMEEPL